VATRRRGGADLDDLKARLGLNEPAAAPAPAAPTPVADDATAPPSPPDAAQAESSVTAEGQPEARPAAKPAVQATVQPTARATASPAASAQAKAPMPNLLLPEVDDGPDEDDYASAAAVDQTVDLDPNAFDPEVTVPGKKFNPAILVVILVVAVLGLGFGYFTGSANSERNLVNAQTGHAETVFDAAQATANQLTALRSRLGDINIDSGYNADFNTILQEAYGTNPPVLNPQVLADGRLVLADERLSRQLIAYSVNTQVLQELVNSHLMRTRQDLAEIQRELAGAQDDRAYGVVFSLPEAFEAYNNIFENPDTPYRPLVGTRVSMASLEPQLPEPPADDAEPDENAEPPVPFFRVEAANGQAVEVPVHDLVLLPREALLPEITSETPLSRYRQRARNINETLEAVVGTQRALIEQLEQLKDRDTYVAF